MHAQPPRGRHHFLDNRRCNLERMGRVGHVLQHFSTKDGIEAGIWCGDSGDVADEPDFRLQAFIWRACPRPAPWYWQKACDTQSSGHSIDGF